MKILKHKNLLQPTVESTHVYVFNQDYNFNLVLSNSVRYVICKKQQLDNLNKYKHLEDIHIHYD